MTGIIWAVLAVSALGAFICCKARAATPAVTFTALALFSVFLLLPAGAEVYAVLADVFDVSAAAVAQ